VSWKEKTPFSATDEKQWRNVPYVNFNYDDRQVKLNSNWNDNSNDNLAAPSFRDSPSRPRLIRAGSHLSERMYPSAQHPSDVLEPGFHLEIGGVGDAMTVLREADKELEYIELHAGLAQADYLLVGVGVSRTF